MMVTFQVFTSYDMANPVGMPADALFGTVTNNTATGFTVAYNLSSGHWVTTVTGTGFTYGQANGQLSVLGGTINSEVANNGTQNVFSLTGAAVDVLVDGNLISGSSELSLWLSGGGAITGSSARDSLLDYSGNHTITGGGGSDRVVFSGAKASYTVTATASGYTVVGPAGTDTLVGISFLKFSDGYYQSAPPGQVVNGTSGNDTLRGGFGNDTINGAGGTDTVALSGPIANYTITQDPVTHGYIVQDSTGFDGSYTLQNISYLQFTDQTLSFVGQTIHVGAGNLSVSGGYGNDTVYGGAGLDTYVLSGPLANYSVSGDAVSGFVVKDNVGLDGTDTLFGIASLQFTDHSQALPLLLTGTSANDTIISGPGNDTVNGGAGTDTLVFSGNRADYSISRTSTGYIVTDNLGRDGSDTIVNVELFQFSDQTIPVTAQTLHLGAGDLTVTGGYGNDTIYGGSGLDTVALSGPKANYSVTGNATSGYVVTDNVGLDGADTLFGISTLQFTDQNQTLNRSLTGGGANDTLVSGPGNDSIVGTGTDTVAFTGNRADYTVTKTLTGYEVIDKLSRDGIDQISNVQYLKFADSTVDTHAVAAASYESAVQELYIAYFGRPADSGGLANFENSLLFANAPADIAGLDAAYVTNASVQYYVDQFGLSPESARLYGTGDTTSFVKAIFNNVVNRDPLSGGLNFYVNAIDSGQITKGHAALSIMSGALQNTTTQGLIDAAGVINKVSVGIDFTFNIDTPDEVSAYAGQAAAATARNMLTAVTAASDPVAMQTTVASTLNNLVATFVGTPPPSISP